MGELLVLGRQTSSGGAIHVREGGPITREGALESGVTIRVSSSFLPYDVFHWCGQSLGEATGIEMAHFGVKLLETGPMG